MVVCISNFRGLQNFSPGWYHLDTCLYHCSNENTKRYGFKTHSDGSDPTTWSADEVPASQSAQDNIGSGMASNQIHLQASSDGTLYCTAKTRYAKAGQPQLILLVRRSSGKW